MSRKLAASHSEKLLLLGFTWAIWWDSLRLSGQKPTSTSPFCISFALPNQGAPVLPLSLKAWPQNLLFKCFSARETYRLSPVGMSHLQVGKRNQRKPQKICYFKSFENFIFPIPKNAIDWGPGAEPLPLQTGLCPDPGLAVPKAAASAMPLASRWLTWRQGGRKPLFALRTGNQFQKWFSIFHPIISNPTWLSLVFSFIFLSLAKKKLEPSLSVFQSPSPAGNFARTLIFFLTPSTKQN